MDPHATLQQIIDAAAENDQTAYIDACQALADWLRRGGFAPSVGQVKGLRYIPGTGTPWALVNPLDPGGRWQLVRYSVNGTAEAYWLAE